MIRIVALAALCCLMAPDCFAGSTIIAPEVPQPRAPGDVVGLVLQNAGDHRTGTKLITFGQVFGEGQVPAHAALALAAGRSSAPVQADVKSTYPDGSARFAVLTLAAPPLRRDEKLPAMLRRAGRAQGGAVDLARALAAHDIVVTLKLQAVGDPARTGQIAQTLSFDAARMLDRARADHTASPWLSGPLATEERVSARVAGSLRLVLDLRAYADGAVGADIQLDNDIAMEKQGGTAEYAVTVTQGGRAVFALPHVKQYQYQDWHTIIRSDGRAPINVVHDVAAMERIGAVYSYALADGVASRDLYGEARQIEQPGWDAPLGDVGLAKYEPMTGGRSDIGPTTTANALWLITQNPVAAMYAIGQADTAGALPWHMFYLKTHDFLTIEDIPDIWTDGRGGPSSGSTGLTQQVGNATGWTPDTAHEPDLVYVPYMMTGRRYYLDQLDAIGTWNEDSTWPAPQARNNAQGIVVGESNQVRGSAWEMRTIGEAVFIGTDGSPMKRFFTLMLRNNLDYLLSHIPQWTREEGAAHGYIPGAYGNGGNMAPWEQDFFVITVGLIARQGNQDAAKVIGWTSNFLNGRFLSAPEGFRRHDAVAYNLETYDTNTKSFYRSWGEIERATAAMGWSNGDGWAHSQGYYAQVAAAALATTINVTHSRQSWRAYQWLADSGAPDFSLGPFVSELQYWIVPLGAPPPHLAGLR